MIVHVALLRGINVGGHHKLAMATLRALLVEVGLTEVTTYVQSGNAVFRVTGWKSSALAAELESRLSTALGFEVPVTLRTAHQLADLERANPFLARGAEISKLSVGFLASAPGKAQVHKLLADPLNDPATAGGDAFELRGQEVFLHHPGGYGRSKLTNNFFDRRLDTMMTVRNWRTVVQLSAMAQRLGS